MTMRVIPAVGDYILDKYGTFVVTSRRDMPKAGIVCLECRPMWESLEHRDEDPLLWNLSPQGGWIEFAEDPEFQIRRKPWRPKDLLPMSSVEENEVQND